VKHHYEIYIQIQDPKRRVEKTTQQIKDKNLEDKYSENLTFEIPTRKTFK